jgi:hypothetical protein
MQNITEKKGTVTEIIDQDNFKMKFKSSNLRTVISGIIFGLVLVILFIKFDINLNPYYYLGAIVLILIYLLIEQALWNKYGVRTIEINRKEIIISRGSEETKEYITISKIKQINTWKLFLNYTVKIKFDWRAYKTDLPKKKQKTGINISQENFDKKEFKTFIEKLKLFAPVNSH